MPAKPRRPTQGDIKPHKSHGVFSLQTITSLLDGIYVGGGFFVMGAFFLKVITLFLGIPFTLVAFIGSLPVVWPLIFTFFLIAAVAASALLVEKICSKKGKQAELAEHINDQLAEMENLLEFLEEKEENIEESKKLEVIDTLLERVIPERADNSDKIEAKRKLEDYVKKPATRAEFKTAIFNDIKRSNSKSKTILFTPLPIKQEMTWPEWIRDKLSLLGDVITISRDSTQITKTIALVGIALTFGASFLVAPVGVTLLFGASVGVWVTSRMILRAKEKTLDAKKESLGAENNDIQCQVTALSSHRACMLKNQPVLKERDDKIAGLETQLADKDAKLEKEKEKRKAAKQEIIRLKEGAKLPQAGNSEPAPSPEQLNKKDIEFVEPKKKDEKETSRGQKSKQKITERRTSTHATNDADFLQNWSSDKRSSSSSERQNRGPGRLSMLFASPILPQDNTKLPQDNTNKRLSMPLRNFNDENTSLNIQF